MTRNGAVVSGIITVAMAMSLTACSPRGGVTNTPQSTPTNGVSNGVSSTGNGIGTTSTTGTKSTTGSSSSSDNNLASNRASEPDNSAGTAGVGSVTAPKGFQPRAVQMIDLQHAFITDGNTLYSTSDGGTSWHKAWQGQGTIRTLDFENSTDGFALVDTGANLAGLTKGLELWHTTDGGAHWTTVATQKQMGLSSINPHGKFHLRFTSRNSGIITVSPKAVASSTTGGIPLATSISTNNGGATWTKLTAPKNTIDATYVNTETGYAVISNKNNTDIEKTENGGQSWQTLKTIKTQHQLFGGLVKTFGNEGVWVQLIGGVGMNQASYTLYRSNDGGASWKTVIAQDTAGAGAAPGGKQHALTTRGPGTEPGRLDVVSSNVAYLSGTCPACGATGQVQVAKLGRNSVTVLPAKLTGIDSWVLFLDSTHGWLVTSLGGRFTDVYQTSNGGGSWQLKSRFTAS